jgi:hypothetical protein
MSVYLDIFHSLCHLPLSSHLRDKTPPRPVGERGGRVVGGVSVLLSSVLTRISILAGPWVRCVCVLLGSECECVVGVWVCVNVCMYVYVYVYVCIEGVITTPYSSVLYYTTLYYTMLYCTIPHCTAL